MVKQHSASSPDPMSAAGLLGWLYDMSFTRHYAPQVIKAVYWLVTVFFSLVAVVALVRLFQEGRPVRIIIGVILIVAAYVVYLTVARIVLEVLIVIFRMGEDLSAIRTTPVQPAGSPAYPTDRPYYMPMASPSPPPATPPAAVPPVAAWPAQPGNAISLGPYLEETVGYGDDVESPERAAEEDEPLPPADGAGATGGTAYPPEADGPPWIT